MIETARNHCHPRLVVVSSRTHYWTEFDLQIIENHELLKVLGSKEYCTTEYVVCKFHYFFLIYSSTMRHHYPDTKRKNGQFGIHLIVSNSYNQSSIYFSFGLWPIA